MNNEALRKCPQCGTLINEDAPAGLCPNCLMALNLKTETVFTGDVSAGQLPLPPEDIAPHFPQLEILECLGRGGMGVVYKARQKSLNRMVALKLLAPERVMEAKFAERFTCEAHALAALNHPHIVTVYDFGKAGGFYFLLMEFVDGVNLRQLLQAKKLTPEEALAVIPPLCDALQYAHEHGIVHRDIKPENLLLCKGGRVKIADFGIAKMVGDKSSIRIAESQPAGTPQYMAPEQKDHQQADHRADIYSLGVVLYEMLTGELPAEKLQAPSRKVLIDVRLDEIVLRALEKTPELRYQTAAEMRTQVEAMTRPQSVATHDAANRPVAVRILLRVGAILLLCIACIGLVVSASWKVSRSEKAEANALHSHDLASKVRVATGTRLATASGHLSPVSGAPAKWQINALVAEADTASTKIGQDVSFTLDAFPQGISLGKIAQIGRTPIIVQNSVTYETIIDVNEGAAVQAKFKPGMTVSVTFIVEVYPGLPGGGTFRKLAEEEKIRLALNRLEQVRQLYKSKPDLVSWNEVEVAESELAVAEARGDLLKRAESRLTMATKHLERIENAHRTGNVGEAEYNHARQRKLEAQLEKADVLRNAGEAASSRNTEEEIIRLARERLEQTRQLYAAKHVSASTIDEAEGELALAEARGDLSKRAEVRLTMATKYLERLEDVHRTGNISDAEYNEARQRKLEAQLELQRTRSDALRKAEKNTDLKSAE